MTTKRPLVPILFLFVLSIHGYALSADHYVSPTGSDTWANSTNISTPCSISTAIANASAGDTVFMRSGTYTFSATLNAVNHGTSGNEVIFKNYNGENVTLSFGAYAWKIDKRYWRLEESASGDVSAININGGGLNVGTDSDASNFYIDGWEFTMTGGGDNNAAIIVNEYSDPYTVKNCTITGPGTGVHGNTALIYTRLVTNASTIENCVLSGPSPKGIYYKHSAGATEQLTVKNCYIYGTFSYNALYGAGGGTLYQNNIIDGGVTLGEDGGSTSGDNNTFIHNTITGGFGYHDHNDAPTYYCANTHFQDNIIEGHNDMHPYATVNGQDTTPYVPFGQTGDYNLWQSGTSAFTIDQTNYSVAGYQTLLGGCPGSNNDCNSISGAPTYVGGASPSTIAGFALDVGSTGENAASDGADMGADVSLVGISAGDDITPPTFSSASVNSVAFTLNFSETVVTTGYDSGDCVVTGSSTGAHSVTSFSGSGSSRTATLASGIEYGETATLSCTLSTDDIEDTAGNDMVTFGPESVTNNTPQPNGLALSGMVPAGLRINQ